MTYTHDGCLAHAKQQLTEYHIARADRPEDFGDHDGAWDGTPRWGPMPLPLAWVDPASGEVKWRVVWGVHKHPFPLSYIYCFGHAIDSAGERSDPNLLFDIRNLPKKYIGRFKLDRDAGCGRKSHRTILQRALADGFDLASIAESVVK